MQSMLVRPRRIRRHPNLRDLVREVSLTKNDLIMPIFITEQGSHRTDIPSLPGVQRIPLQELVAEVKTYCAIGLKGVALFAVTDSSKRNSNASEAINPAGLLQRATQILKENIPEMILFVDVALDPFTDHGHDGLLDTNGDVDNDATVNMLCEMAATLARAGADYVAPSDMMDGRVQAIRKHLDKLNFQNTGILAYSAKFASALYGPFRDALKTKNRGLDKRSYQLEPENKRQALLEAYLDIEEGADMIMVKPATLYLDIIHELKQRSRVPVVAYHVSGEYAMLKAACAQNWLDEAKIVKETLVSIKRAGADLIISYYAAWVARELF